MRRYDGSGEPQLVSPPQGDEPVWSRDGRELFFSNRAQRTEPYCLFAVPFSEKGPVGPPRLLFRLDRAKFWGLAPVPNYDVFPDGRFITMRTEPMPLQLPPTHVDVVLNWFEELKAKVAVRQASPKPRQ